MKYGKDISKAKTAVKAETATPAQTKLYNANPLVQYGKCISEATKAAKAKTQEALAKIPDHDTDVKQQVLKQSAHDFATNNQHRKGQVGKGAKTFYKCDYCSQQKWSKSTGSDGQVRIRCGCGGGRKDGKPRLHAW